MSNAFTPTRLTTAVVTVLTLSLCAAAQNDWHMASRNLFVKSAFAHGYMHGYEEGFHNGDLDVQMGRYYREVKTQERYHRPVGYRYQYGDREYFDAGYHKGFLVGYNDSFAGRNFRAVQLMKAEDRRMAEAKARFDREFDHAFRDGYESGQKQGLQDGRVSEVTKKDAFACAAAGVQGQMASTDYCGAFQTGYSLGYSDGFANQKELGPVFARNQH